MSEPVKDYPAGLIEILSPYIYPLPVSVGKITGFRTFGCRIVADTESGVVAILPPIHEDDEIF